NTFESLTWLMDLDVDPDNPSIWLRSRTGIFVLPIRHPSHDRHPEATYCRLADLVSSCSNSAPMEKTGCHTPAATQRARSQHSCRDAPGRLRGVHSTADDCD